MVEVDFTDPQQEYWFHVSPQDVLPLAGTVAIGMNLQGIAHFFAEVAHVVSGIRDVVANYLIREPSLFGEVRQFLGIGEQRAYLDLSYIASRTPHPTESSEKVSRMLNLGGRRLIDSLACAVAAIALCGCSAATDTPRIVPLNYLPSLTGDYFPIRSAAMGSTYHIYIRYPENYASKPGTRYPIVYLLDGDSTFPLVAPEHLFLTLDDKLPDAIIVGIAYGSFAPPVNHREIDFGSRAPDFQRFLSDELIPAVEKRTRADPDRRILVGQSFGGNFVLYSAFTDPDLFWARIASNPSARMHQSLMATTPVAARRRDLHLIVVSGTANNADGREAALRWTSQWRQRPTPWAVDEIDIPGGTHAADFDNAYRLALRRLFELAR